jgi:excisionase family DNA binding protein
LIKEKEQDCQDQELLLKPDRVAKTLGLGRTKVYEMLATGKLPVTRIGTAVRVSRQDLLAWIEANTEKAA